MASCACLLLKQTLAAFCAAVCAKSFVAKSMAVIFVSISVKRRSPLRQKSDCILEKSDFTLSKQAYTVPLQQRHIVS
jgi:hypothetical protein